ncbi:hypothetical protein [Celeribacter naphthalenivorans]|uniref:hypothetical protein n=1 Tax=Celeribacter naphthalenivorans TaxID=1614694 RepID=UPI001CFC2726|nr:hypothetical protein [Celeribacter naphthalenivorans]
MSFTEITPYDGQLPSSDDSASFDGRAAALMSWLVANFAPELQALAVEIATALNGEEDTLASLQALRGDLKNVARVSPHEGANLHALTETGFFVVDGTAGNLPSEGRHHAIAVRNNYDNLTLLLINALTSDLYLKAKVGGVWQTPVRFARADEVPGLGQRWDDVSSEYSSGIAYQNTEPREIEFAVQINTNAGSGSTDIQASHDGVTWVSLANISGNNGKTISFSVPPLGYFRSSNAGAVLGWKVKRTV